MKPLAILVLCLFISSCGDDENIDLSCMQSDWVGTYTGTRICDGGMEQDVTLTFSAIGSRLSLFYLVGINVTTHGEIDFNGCEIDDNITSQNVNYSIKATLNGSELTMEDRFVVGNALGPLCKITATKN
ncbi:MAG: hypothetical protein AAGF87_03645 [Bacteroidota bacterium]